MDLDDAVQRWRDDGFAVLPGYLSTDALAPGVAELPLLYPTADEFHADADDPRRAGLRDEFGGISDFPFASVALSLLAVHPALVTLAAALLGTDAVRVYSIEAWAKYTGAADYDQHHHRDYLNQTLMVPSWDDAFRQVELFVSLVDVPEALGPPHFVPRASTAELDVIPNWLPRVAGVGVDHEHPTWVAQDAHPRLYDVEVSGAGPAGTVVAYSPGTFHRGTPLTAPRGARYTLHVNFRRADAEWAVRHSWLQRSIEPAWHAFVAAATPRQLELFGVPPPGHAFWTDETLAGMQVRYPDLDLTPWRQAVSTASSPTA
jgi:hypothetical protein